MKFLLRLSQHFNNKYIDNALLDVQHNKTTKYNCFNKQQQQRRYQHQQNGTITTEWYATDETNKRNSYLHIKRSKAKIFTK